MDRIPISGPWITQKEVDYVSDAAATAWYANHAKYHVRFEKAFAEYVGTKYAVSLPSCTSAIHLSLAALGVGPGDEVIVPDLTWIASSAPISYVGATPVFVDVDEATWCLSAEALEAAITPKTRAVIVVDLYGGMADYDAIRAVARQHGLAVIEDAAEAIGSEYKDRRAGSLGDTGTFSFHGSKTMTTGEGGMLVTDRDDIYERVMVLRDHGRQPGDTMFFNAEVGFKYKMSSLQAALGLAQLERIEELIARKRDIFQWYREELSDEPDMKWNHEPPGVKNTYWMVTLLLPPEWGIPKEALVDQLNRRDVDTRPFFHPLSSIPAYANAPSSTGAKERNPAAYRISPYGINLPCGLNMTRDMVGRVGRAVRESLNVLLPKTPSAMENREIRVNEGENSK
ncbi:MAG: DegT/DnrJ/EryC1/StrS family aminotransferase [Phycisphaerae bacterium]|nr:DegT/DnrJ/EryC1/StrS family aminotransferase [Phycisphaerae bacterium]